ncbi:hypothetical protein C8A00DRAFT_17214 [Chaetomidium leptoderma]|uniref:Mtf2-like C-terminal domain-containing protein n=1 Tax=Chaetomidium leptoderma TaxID=669021 RepID=A0AAN6VH10_9PEZI|nr:hypothetical protein C8A00DRAFT_17214 [Chaetomidium leptoderma]
MSTTLLPFLYQTRTLQRLSRTGFSTPAFRALLHSTARTNHPRERPRAHQPSPRNDDIPFELPEGYENPDKKVEVGRDSESGGVRSTITPTEQDVFSRIFEEIATRTKPGAPIAVPPTLHDDYLASIPDEEPAAALPLRGFREPDDFGVRTEEPNPESIRSTINVIVQDAAEVQTNSRRQMRNPFDALHPLGQTSAATEWERALLRFPPSLRQAARMALSTIEEDKVTQRFADPAAASDEYMGEEKRATAQIDLVLDPLSKSVKDESFRREERNRVDTKMRAATTDFELWDVLEEEVFPLVHKLGINEDPSDKQQQQQQGQRGRNKRDKSKLPLHIYGPLYPTYLLNALRLLDVQFSRSSPLALHILPRVKALGPASYVLGVSTPFYNELARVLWNRYGDPTAVFNLLEEMRVAGLYCDESTRIVVQRIEQFLGSVGQGRWGPFLRELASLPEYEFAILPRIRHWLKTINSHIYERRNELQE